MATSESVYRKLEKDNDIRLLNLLPAWDRESAICCTLTHTSLPSPHPYETISYAWGDHVFDSTILLDDFMFYATANLASILRYLRRAEEPRLLWVDAICINQKDMKERAQQVGLMRTIFSKCHRALAWVGPDANQRRREKTSEDLVKGMDLMKRIGEQDIETLRPMEESYALTGYEKPDTRDNIQGVDDGGNIKPMIFGDDDQFLFYKLFRHATLWSRSWIVQELACSPQVTLLCEGGELDWQIMSNFSRDQPYADAFHLTFSHGSRLAKSLQYMFQEPLKIEHQRWISQGIPLENETSLAPKSTLLDVLARFCDKESSDPRDKVYSLLGLVEEGHGIVVDYTESVEQLFQEVTIGVINKSRNLDILCQNPFEPRNPEYLASGFMPGVREEGRLPSWVADLRLKGASPLFAHRNIYNAGKPNCDVRRCIVGHDQGSLILKGCIIGRIGSILQNENSWASFREVMLMYLGRAILEDHPIQYYPFRSRYMTDREPIIQAYWRTVLKDCTSPPRMRRLRQDEITLLSTKNEDTLRSSRRRESLLYSYKSSFNDPIQSSSFPYLEDDGELVVDRDSGKAMFDQEELEQSNVRSGRTGAKQ